VNAQVISETDVDDESWEYAPGDELLPGKHAIACLGDGMRTESWLAWDAARWAPVVVKVARPGHVTSDATVRALAREADAHRRLIHPALQRMLEDGAGATMPHLVLEYIQGPTLAGLVAQRGRLNAVDVVRLGLQIASVLHYAHGEGLLHLDVKPGNVVLRAGQAVLIDLGFVRPVGWAPPDASPRGSWRHMAPEQCRGEPSTERTDLFGLGTVLYEVATGQRAFQSTEECMEQLERAATPARTHAPELPDDLDALIGSLLERDPSRRPSSAADVLAALDSAIPPDVDHVWPSFGRQLLDTRRAAVTDRAAG
jgi:eukaryotic-like serine/threonine-protein kinase